MPRATVEKTPNTNEPAGIALRMPEALTRPHFANLVHSAFVQMEDNQPVITLSFVSVYGLPTATDKTEMQGEVVARVTLPIETARRLRDLLQGQLANAAQPAKLPQPSRSQVRKRKK